MPCAACSPPPCAATWRRPSSRRGSARTSTPINPVVIVDRVVYTPLHRETPQDVMESLSPMGRPSTVKDITDAVMYLTDAATVTGHILYVDGGAHFGRW